MEALLESVYDRVFNLSIRYLGDPDSAKDATQEICIKILTKYDSFRGESLFSTWALAVASNYLRTTRKSFLENACISFNEYEADCALSIQSEFDGTDAESKILTEELKHSCSMGMLQCLDRTDRLVYILHTFFDVTGNLGAEISGLTPEAYRQRLSRVKKEMSCFLEKNCGLFSAGAPCHCENRVPHALKQGRINKKDRMFTTVLETLDGDTAAFRSNSAYRLTARQDEIRRILSLMSDSLDLKPGAISLGETKANA